MKGLEPTNPNDPQTTWPYRTQIMIQTNLKWQSPQKPRTQRLKDKTDRPHPIHPSSSNPIQPIYFHPWGLSSLLCLLTPTARARVLLVRYRAFGRLTTSFTRGRHLATSPPAIKRREDFKILVTVGTLHRLNKQIYKDADSMALASQLRVFYFSFSNSSGLLLISLSFLARKKVSVF